MLLGGFLHKRLLSLGWGPTPPHFPIRLWDRTAVPPATPSSTAWPSPVLSLAWPPVETQRKGAARSAGERRREAWGWNPSFVLRRGYWEEPGQTLWYRNCLGSIRTAPAIRPQPEKWPLAGNVGALCPCGQGSLGERKMDIEVIAGWWVSLLLGETESPAVHSPGRGQQTPEPAPSLWEAQGYHLMEKRARGHVLRLQNAQQALT